MREVAPGDIILSFCDTRIVAVGVAQSYCFESLKPLEFGGVGAYWENVGWRVTVAFTRLENQIKPQEHMQVNGLLLTPSIDHLFDRGFISFEDTGKLIISPVAHKPSLSRMGIQTERVVNGGAVPASGLFSIITERPY